MGKKELASMQPKIQYWTIDLALNYRGLQSNVSLDGPLQF